MEGDRAKIPAPFPVGADWEFPNTLVPLAALWALMDFSLAISCWLMTPLAILAGAFLIGTFVIFRDCIHDSFFNPAV